MIAAPASAEDPDPDHEQHRRHLDHHHHGVERRALLHPLDRDRRHDRHDDHCRQVDHRAGNSLDPK
jgi:hypothetical protein